MVTWQRRSSLRNSRVMGITALGRSSLFLLSLLPGRPLCSCSLAGALLGRLERGYAELRTNGVLRSSLGLRGLDFAFEYPPLGYEILGTDQRRKGSGAEKAPTRLTGGKSYGRRQA